MSSKKNKTTNRISQHPTIRLLQLLNVYFTKDSRILLSTTRSKHTNTINTTKTRIAHIIIISIKGDQASHNCMLSAIYRLNGTFFSFICKNDIFTTYSTNRHSLSITNTFSQLNIPCPCTHWTDQGTFFLSSFFTGLGNIHGKGQKEDGKALDDYACAATGASILREKSDKED